MILLKPKNLRRKMAMLVLKTKIKMARMVRKLKKRLMKKRRNLFPPVPATSGSLVCPPLREQQI